MSAFGKRLIDHAAEIRLRAVDHWCPEKVRTGEHNNIEARRWFRRYNTCATCGYVERVR